MTPGITKAFYNHHFSAYPPTTVLRHTLQHLLHFTHPSPTYAQDSFRNSLPQNEIPTSIRSNVQICLCTAFPAFRIPSLSLSLTFNHACANNTLHSTRQYTYFRNLTYLYVFFSKGLTKISKSALTHVSRYKTLILNGLYNIKNCLIVTFKKPLSH